MGRTIESESTRRHRQSKTVRTKRQKKQLEFVPHPRAGILKADLLKKGIEIQTVGMDRDGLVHCGVHWVPELNARNLWKLHTHWLRWRKWYDNLPRIKRLYGINQIPLITEFYAYRIESPGAQGRTSLLLR